MQLEKIVMDWYTIHSKPMYINSIKNCVIYVSEYNLECLKKKINEIINAKYESPFLKELEIREYANIINFVKRNNVVLKEKVMQTDELPFIEANNSYIVLVKDVHDIRVMNSELEGLHIAKEVNDTIYIALAEEAQLLTIKDSIEYFVTQNSIPVSVLNIKSGD